MNRTAAISTVAIDSDSRAPVAIDSESSREELIAWLCWNDRNGSYRDADSIREGFDVLTYSDAMSLVLDNLS